MYENHQTPLLPKRVFYARVRHHLLIGSSVLGICVGIGMAGYHWLEHLGWVDSFANASMILSGMGPLDPIRTTAGKLFGGVYALFSGVAFLTTVGFFLMPVLHRLLHKFHLESHRPKDDSGNG
jgi:hypothetical protein